MRLTDKNQTMSHLRENTGTAQQNKSTKNERKRERKKERERERERGWEAETGGQR